MTILSEATIKAYIDRGQIIVDGDERFIRGQSYSCHAAKVFPGGPGDPDNNEAPIVDWGHPKGTDVYRIQPRQLVWVRIRETVRLPTDICAFWWQTNSLSRKGLMLVNMSMVDPGYEGALACLFVNFGRQPVDIDPGMTVARLVFHRLDGTNKAFDRGVVGDEYDRELRDVALNGPTSFLSLQEFSSAFQVERDKAFASFKSEAEAHSRTIQANLEKEVDGLFKDRTDNLPKFLLKSYGIAAGGFALLALAVAFAPWIKDKLALDVNKQVQSAVDAEIGRRLQPASTIGSSSGARDLERRLQELERQIQALRPPPGGGTP